MVTVDVEPRLNVPDPSAGLFDACFDDLSACGLSVKLPIRSVGTVAHSIDFVLAFVMQGESLNVLDPIGTKALYASWLVTAANGDTFDYFRSGGNREACVDHWDYRQLFELVYASSVNREVVLLRRRGFIPDEGRCFIYYALKVSATAPVRLFPKRQIMEFS
jgi:hypothetical protein